MYIDIIHYRSHIIRCARLHRERRPRVPQWEHLASFCDLAGREFPQLTNLIYFSFRFALVFSTKHFGQKPTS